MNTQPTIYNKSQIFKSAWALVKSTGKKLSEALKEAWAKAKSITTNLIKITCKVGSLSFPENIMETGKVVGSLWEKGDKARVYFKVYWKGCSPTDCGYFDLVSNKSYLSSNPRHVARNLEYSLVF